MSTLRQTILGSAFFAALATLGFLTVYLGDFDFGRGRTLTVYFDDVAGLRPGHIVLAHGVEVGKVRSIEFTGKSAPEQRLAVELALAQEVPLREDCAVRIADQTLLGGRQVEILTGTKGTFDRSRLLLGGGRSNPLTAIQDALGGTNGQRIASILDNVDRLTSALAQGDRTLLDYLLNDAQRTDVDGVLASARSIASKIDTGENSLGKLLNSSTLHDDLRDLLRQGGDLLTKTSEGQSTIGKLLTEDTLYQKLLSISDDLKAVSGRIANGEGLAGKLFGPSSDELYDELRALVADARKVAADLSSQDGVLGRLLRDPEWTARFDTMLADLQNASGGIDELVAMIRDGRGVLGYLVADDDARREVQKIVAMIAEALEDAREAAPVSSAASFLFGQF